MCLAVSTLIVGGFLCAFVGFAFGALVIAVVAVTHDGSSARHYRP